MAHVLVVDDEPSARDLLATVLRYAGHQVSEAGDGLEALQRVAQEKPDVVIADLLMPTMDGFEFVRQLREKPGFARTPVVFYSASYLESEARQLAEACGVANIISKPAEPEQILATMARVLGRPHPRIAPPSETEFHREHLSVLTAKLSRRRAEIAPRLGAMIELGLQFASERDPDQLLAAFCTAARRIVGARYAAVGVLDRGRGGAMRRYACGLASEAAEKITSGGELFPLAAELLGQREPVRRAHLPGDPAAAGLPPDFPRVHSLVGAPIVSPDFNYGWVLLIDKLGEGEFSEEDEGLAQILAAQVGRIYENGSLYAHLAQHARALEREVAERRAAASALAQSEQRFRSLVEAAAQIVWRADPAGAMTELSDPAGYTGMSPGDAIGWGWVDRIHPDDRERASALWRRAIAERTRFQTEYRVRMGDGRYRHFQASAVPVFEPDGALREWVGMTTDIHERVLAERALRQSQASLEAAQERARIGSWELHLHTGARRWSRQMFRLFDLDPDQPPPAFEELWQLVHPDDAAALAALHRGFSPERLKAEIDFRSHPERGPLRYFAAIAELVADEHGEPALLAGTVLDITERKRAELELQRLNVELEQRVTERTAELEHTNKELEAFSYSVSHDLRAPLRAITGFSEILLDEHAAALPAPAQRQLRRITDAAGKMGQLIDDLLNLSRVTRHEMTPISVNLSEIATGLAVELRQIDREREVEWRIAPGLVADGDLNLLRVVLDNLLRNAWKFTARKPAAHIELGAIESAGGGRTFFVRDNGAGFDPAYAGRMFTPFHRLHAERDFPGTGIGLAIVSRIVRRHGGRVWAEGAVGEGATFYFTLAEPPRA